MTAPSVSDAAGAAPLTAGGALDRADHHRALDRCCRNCGAVAPGHFCPDCGQTTAVHPPTVGEFVREFLEHHVALEGSLWRTLTALLLTPGRLTVEYFAGRRARYIGPLRLYLTFSLIFFAFTNFSGGGSDGESIVRVQLPGKAAPGAPMTPGAAKPADNRTGIVGYMVRASQRIEAMTPAERNRRVNAGMRQYFPYVLIVLVPVLALYLKIVYWRRGRMYGEHLVVAFHAQTAVFIFALPNALPTADFVTGIIVCVVLVHGFIGLRRVYGGRRIATAAREFVLFTAYGGTVLAALATTATLSLAL